MPGPFFVPERALGRMAENLLTTDALFGDNGRRVRKRTKGVDGMKCKVLAMGVAGLLASSAAHAVDLSGTGLSISGSATGVSDYRFRGISNSNKNPALQLDLSVSHDSGVYAGLWGSTIDLYDDDVTTGFKGGSDVELDYYLGWSGDIAPGLTFDANVTRYTYPGVTGPTNYFELMSSLEFSLGPVGAKIGGAYFPNQKATPEAGKYLYGEISGEIPLGVTLTGHLGRQLSGFDYAGRDKYWEWSLGASRSFGPVNVGLSYVDTDLPKGVGAGATVVGSLGIGF